MKRLLLILSIICTLAAPAKADTRYILVVGNSLSYDAVMQEFLPIIQSMGDDVVIGMPYKGGQTLTDHWNNINGNVQIYNYYECKGGKWSSTGSASRTYSPEIIAKYPWEYVVLQGSSAECGRYETYFPATDNIIAYMKEHLTNPEAQFYIYMPWALETGSSYLVSLQNQGIYVDEYDNWAHNADAAYRVAETIGYPGNVIPSGTAVQNGRTSYIGDRYTRDGRHMNLAHGRYTVALTWYETFYGKSALDVPYQPTSINAYCADMCRHAAHAAMLDPMHVTSMAEDFGTPPEVVIPPLEPSLEDPWDGYTKAQPALDGAGNYVVRCGAELAWIADLVNGGAACDGIYIDSDIDLGGKPWTPIGFGTWFNGICYGNGHKISNFYLNRSDFTSDTHFGGLFGGTNSRSCDILDLSISGTIEIPATMTVKAIIGSFIGKANALGTLRNCHSDIHFIVSGTPGYVGGVIGFMKNADVKNCSYSGNITINGQVTNGVGGILGCTNSAVESVEAVIHGCWFSGSIINNGGKKPKYVAAINPYSNVSKASESIYNNYSVGTIDVTATNMGVVCGKSNTMNFFTDNNYYLNTCTLPAGNAIACPIEAFHSGEVCYNLNDDEPLFGQDLSDPNSLPEAFNGSNTVFRTRYYVDDEVVAVSYHNGTLAHPAAPDMVGFAGWFDENNVMYDDASEAGADLDLYARASSSVAEINAAETSAARYFDIAGRPADPSAKGFLIERRGTQTRKIINK